MFRVKLTNLCLSRLIIFYSEELQLTNLPVFSKRIRSPCPGLGILLKNLLRTFGIDFFGNISLINKTRSKRKKIAEDLKVNDLVWILDDFTPRGLWPLAKVKEIYTSSDGLVRSVKLRTIHGEKARPVIKLSKVLINK